jgi:hypothetical protein
MLTSLAFLAGFLALICAPGLIAQARKPVSAVSEGDA